MVRGLSSALSLAKVTRPSYSVARSSTIGAIARQGPHHGAQKSTITGASAPRTEVAKSPSFTVIGLDIDLQSSLARPRTPFDDPVIRWTHFGASFQHYHYASERLATRRPTAPRQLRPPKATAPVVWD